MNSTLRSIPVLLYVIIISVLIAGCTGAGGGGAQDSDYRTGTGSLTFTFLKSSMPSPLAPNQEYSLGFKVQNVGGYDIERAFVSIVTDGSLITLDQTDFAISNLHGKALDYPAGESIIKNINLKTSGLSQESQTVDADISATVCYPYQTINIADVCIDTDPYNQKAGRKICSVGDVSPKSGGGPVNTNKIAVHISQDDTVITPKFTFTITKPSNMVIVSSGEEKTLCTSRATIPKKEITFRAYLSGDTPNDELRCDKNILTFTADNTATVTCTTDSIEGDSISTHLSPITTVMEYGVVMTQSQKVTIKR